MKKFGTICVSFSLLLVTGVMAQQDEEQQKEKKEPAKKGQQANEARPEASARREQAQGKAQENRTPKAEANRPEQSNRAERANRQEQANRPERANRPEQANAPANEQSPTGRKQGTEQRKNERAAQNQRPMKQASPAPAAATGAQPAASGAAQTNARTAAQAKKPDPQMVQKIKAEHTSFHAQARPQQVPAVTFNQNYRISGVEQWQGPQYEVFRSYHPEWHDAGWYRSRFGRVELIGGGYYYFNNGYWYPAWGFDPGAQYYAYDAPIYVGHRAVPPDQVIADVQAVLQQQGYYRGEVDGLLGPLTREALTAYQSDHGLYATAVIDEPTLDSLGMS